MGVYWFVIFGIVLMIKINPVLLLHFSTGRQIFYSGGLIFYVFSTGKKACVTAADLIDSDENSIASQCLWAVVILKSLLCLSAGALQESRGFSLYEHTAVHIFFTNWQLAPAGLQSDLVTVDANWHRLNLLTDSRHTSPETQTQIWNWLRQQPPSTPVVHYLQTVHYGQRLLCLPMADQAPPELPADAGQKQKKKHIQQDCLMRRKLLSKRL